MRVPLSWLREHVDPGLAPEELAIRLSRTGTMVEAIHHLGVPAGNGNLGAFRVGRVIETSRPARSSAGRPTSPRGRPWPWPSRAPCSRAPRRR